MMTMISEGGFLGNGIVFSGKKWYNEKQQLSLG